MPVVDRRRRSLSARAYPLGETAAFGLWAEALERHLRPLPTSEVGALCGGFLDDLAGLLRSAAAARGAVPDREPSRLRLIEGLTVVLANLAQQTDGEPLVVSLDDVHWAFTSDLKRFGDGGVYLNFIGDEGDDRIRSAFGSNYPRLAAIKAEYDPDNLFRLNHNIRPERRGEAR